MEFLNDKAWNSFFFHGKTPEDTIHDDIMTGLVQPRGSIFFDRSYGAGVERIENRSGLSKEIDLRFAISEFFANRNNDVSESLQAITSNEAIQINKTGGDMDIVVNYFRPDLTQGEITI